MMSTQYKDPYRAANFLTENNSFQLKRYSSEDQESFPTRISRAIESKTDVVVSSNTLSSTCIILNDFKHKDFQASVVIITNFAGEAQKLIKVFCIRCVLTTRNFKKIQREQYRCTHQIHHSQMFRLFFQV